MAPESLRQADRRVLTSRRSRRHQSRHSRSLRNFKLATLLFGLGFVGAFIGWIHVWMSLGASELERLRLAADLRHRNGDLTSCQATADRLQGKLDSLVQGRLPDLMPFTLDRTLDIHRRYVKNLAFTRVGRGDHQHYEYRVVLDNASGQVLTPEVRILLFDDSGIQIGDARLDRKNAANAEDTALDFLAPGESRSYFGTIKIEDGGIPKYFDLQIH